MKSFYYISRVKPEGFQPEMEACGCCCVHKDKILLLKRNKNKPYGDTWGVPGGKIEEQETLRECVVREIYEESGLNVDDDTLQFMGTLYCKILVKEKDFCYTFHLFKKEFDHSPELNIRMEEHVDGNWYSIDEAYRLPLIIGGKEVLDFYFNPNHTDKIEY